MEWYEVLILVLAGLTLAYWIWKLAKPPKYDGVIRVFVKADGTRVFSLELESDPMEMTEAQEVKFLVTFDDS